MFRSLYGKTRQELKLISAVCVQCVFRASVCSVCVQSECVFGTETLNVHLSSQCPVSAILTESVKHYCLHCPALCLCFHTQQRIWWRYTHAFRVYSVCVCVCVCVPDRERVCVCVNSRGRYSVRFISGWISWKQLVQVIFHCTKKVYI